ncbi:39S ribosomal protein L41, mitochondrial [Belonocnema kinseyi]|uniref:39S ribosomal protein L41, mitochondrial n=1 Tax=Belonocnema kinseyi TaxID=2817044 RepID=UPI00143CFE1F|nr:39S ribosomal protein L41, mitochondrial [Belonocnema kinseyi]
MASACLVITRGISTTCARYGKRNFRKFMLHGKRGSRFHKEREAGPDRQLPVDKRGVRDIGYMEGNLYNVVPEMIPEIIVPSLEGFKLKPYVTYQSENVTQEEFTPEDLFNAVYATKIADDFEKGQLTSDGQALNPSENEKLTPDEAKLRAAKTGADMFDADKEEIIRAYKKMIEDSKLKAKENLKTRIQY